MSLQVWLPLKGDLHNQGLSSTTFSGTAAYKSYGKLGGQSLNLQNRIACSTPALNDVQFFSIAFWCRIEANPDSTADYMDIIGFTDQKSDNSANGQFRFETGYLSDSEGGVHWHDNTTNAIINGFNRYNTAAQRNEWHHIVVTIADNSVKSYYDGALQKTQTTNLNKGHLTGSWWMGESTTRGCIQDVRIYDHCLSPKEVEEIAKGLVLHYPLNNNGLGNTNLALNTFYEMRPYTIPSHYARITNNASTDFFNLSVGDTYTCRAKITAGEKDICLRIEFYTDSNTRTSIFGNWIAAGTTGYSTITSTLTAEQRNYSLMQICLQSGVNTSTSGMCGELKLEKGSMATPWCPNNINTNIIYDTSGYCNNGIIVGDITTITPSPRYNVAAHLESSSPTTNNDTGLTYIQTAFRLTAPTQMTICWWGHPESGLNGNSNHAAWCTSASSSAPTDYDQTAFHHRDKRFDICLNSASSTSLSLRFDNYTLNEWHYYSVTYDGKIAILYKDGIETNRSTISSSEAPLKTFSYLYIGFSEAGGVYRKTLGSYSDFRIYATALSAQQIKELYTTSMQIDSSGNVFARELVEL